MEYKIVKVPTSNGSSGDTIILVVEDFEHVGSDGSPAFGDPRYVPCNPGVLTALQRPAPPSPARKGTAQGNNTYDWSFTQSLDPTDLLFLENTCTQTFQKQSVSFPVVVSDLDWRIPLDQERILAGVELLSVAEYEYSDVELSESEDDEKAAAKKIKNESIVFPLTQSTQLAQMSQFPTIPTSQCQFPGTQVHVHQFPGTQGSITQAPMTQDLFVPQSPLKSSPQRSATTPVIFAETQVSASPVRIVENNITEPASSPFLHNSEIQLSPPRKFQNPNPVDVRMSSPINSPIKPTASHASSPIKQEIQSQSHPIMEYPDYSSW